MDATRTGCEQRAGGSVQCGAGGTDIVNEQDTFSRHKLRRSVESAPDVSAPVHTR